ncbi:hypothetical protein [Haliscomenobacter sp.]|uniref:hypothetical protein n=1 Tax=Haliscomenobacter sp. TaxID=2717303 RepID=UPI003BA8E37B
MKTLRLLDGYGFNAIANLDQYDSFVAKNWDFDLLKKHFLQQMSLNRILIWTTTPSGGTWQINLVDEKSDEIPFREIRGVIEVSNKRLYLCNYETLTMAAQFETVQLPEPYLSSLFIEMENGKYGVTIRQMNDLGNCVTEDTRIDFELVFQKIKKFPEIYHNQFSNIIWWED